MKFLYSVRLEDEIGKFRRLGGRNLNFACWADDTDLILEFLILGVLIQNYHKNHIKKIKIPIHHPSRQYSGAAWPQAKVALYLFPHGPFLPHFFRQRIKSVYN